MIMISFWLPCGSLLLIDFGYNWDRNYRCWFSAVIKSWFDDRDRLLSIGINCIIYRLIILNIEIQI